MRLHRDNQSKLLRGEAAARCKYCGTPIEWFDRHDSGRIPLTPELPARRVPDRFRWHVNVGVAYRGTPADSGYCRIPHTAVCPAVEHTGLPPDIDSIVQMLAVRMRSRIEKGEFAPALVEPTEPAAPAAAKVPEVPVRHVLRHHTNLQLAPGAIEEVRCIVTEGPADERCPNMIFDLGEGCWERVDVPYAAGRAGQMVLNSSGGLMWVWSVPEFMHVRRWWKQCCPAHEDVVVADHMGTEWVPFETWRHGEYIVTEQPTGYERPAEEFPIHEGPRELWRCAEPGCFNSSVHARPEGWLCWKCAQARERRTRTHRRWQNPASP
ncbi:DUF6083 domain-containing protein [Streptomyces violascens]|uniref:Uncharacterized protein n=1 Tax=Streptomyces violascens TaxID=67381 RepID=A0ABQ3QFN1_9ACTN|nr:DUF6083 domain-containing protein [Streptomyces violascens]GGT87464.1 hypothetical protein GCM10010289_04250 [Streptomyces violascens]GHI36091.1 hypothetical protein Sviol_04990 [Streptomyces violascens]